MNWRGVSRACAAQLRLLLANPAELGDRVGAGHLQARRRRCDQRHAAVRRMHGEVDMLDVLARHRDRRCRRAGSSRSSVARLVLDDLEDRLRRLAVAGQEREERVEHLRSRASRRPSSPPAPARASRGRSRAPAAALLLVVGSGTGSVVAGMRVAQVVEEHDRLRLAVQHRGNARVGLLLAPAASPAPRPCCRNSS